MRAGGCVAVRPGTMTVFRQENLEEHYETGEDLGRWVRAGGKFAGGSRRGHPPKLIINNNNNNG